MNDMNASSRTEYLTASDIYRYIQCPHWPYFERFATPEERALKREFSEGELRRLENGVLHEEEIAARLFGEDVMRMPIETDVARAAAQTLEQMRAGVRVIYQGTLMFGDLAGRPDILERHDGASVFGEWHYVPVDIKSTHALEKYQKLQLMFYATLLEHVQHRFPTSPAILNSDGERISFEAADMVKEFEELIVELERIRAGERPDPVLRKSCYDTGPWGKACELFARQSNDIALLYNVDQRKLRALRELGVRTVEDAALMDPESLDGAAPGLRVHGLEVAKMQAQALQYETVIVREPVALPDRGLEIHFDIESDPPRDVDYLYGFLLRESTGNRYLSFIAERPEDEEKMWRAFLAWIETLPPEYVVYHFAAYEKSRLGILETRYGGSAFLDLFRTRMIDLKEIVSSSIVFPLYFYGLKYILPFLGFHWSGDVKGGGQSVDVFEQYVETGDAALLRSIVVYNEFDVRATAYLKDWLVKYAMERKTYQQPYPWEKGK